MSERNLDLPLEVQSPTGSTLQMALFQVKNPNNISCKYVQMIVRWLPKPNYHIGWIPQRRNSGSTRLCDICYLCTLPHHTFQVSPFSTDHRSSVLTCSSFFGSVLSWVLVHYSQTEGMTPFGIVRRLREYAWLFYSAEGGDCPPKERSSVLYLPALICAVEPCTEIYSTQVCGSSWSVGHGI